MTARPQLSAALEDLARALHDVVSCAITAEKSHPNDELQSIAVALRKKGWSQRRAADALGVSATHLSLVLNGHRISRRLLKRIQQLPTSPIAYRPSGFAAA